MRKPASAGGVILRLVIPAVEPESRILSKTGYLARFPGCRNKSGMTSVGFKSTPPEPLDLELRVVQLLCWHLRFRLSDGRLLRVYYLTPLVEF
ncbi:MAG: hypothetical protein ACE5FZ_08690 [Nitrospiria bacterium]